MDMFQRGGGAPLLLRLAATLIAVAMLAGACSNDKADGNAKPDNSGLDSVYSEIEGLSDDERRDRLIELALAEQDEVGTATLYGSTNLDEADPIISAFEDASGIEVNLYRASAGDVLQRVLQESDAGFPGADVVYINGPEMTVLDAEGLLAPLDSPATDDIADVAVFETWSAVYLNLFTAAWNTDLVSGGEEPGTWEEVLAGYPGRLALEAGDFDWFATLVTQYFMEDKGLSEEEAIEVFRTAAKESRVVDGHTLMAELLAAGDFDVAASTYRHRVGQLARDGAPVAWEPAVEPLIVRPNGIGIVSGSKHPAQALLFTEFMLTEVQEMLLEFDRTPASQEIEGGGVPQNYDVLEADLELLFDEREKWEDLWDEIVSTSGGIIE